MPTKKKKRGFAFSSFQAIASSDPFGEQCLQDDLSIGPPLSSFFFISQMNGWYIKLNGRNWVSICSNILLLSEPRKKEENIVLESSSCPLYVLEPFPSRKWSTCCCKMLAASHSKYVTVWKLEKFTLTMLQKLLREKDLHINQQFTL